MAEKRKPMRTSWRTRRPKTGPAALVRSGEEAHSPVRRRKSGPGKCDLPTCSTEQKTRNRTMEDRIIELLHRNLQEVFGEGDAARRRAAFRTSILKTACCTSRPVFLLDTTLWTSSPQT